VRPNGIINLPDGLTSGVYKAFASLWQVGADALFAFNLSLNLLDSQPDNITARFIELFAAIFQITHRLFVSADFQLDVLWVFRLWSACTGRHIITLLSVYTLIA
jgi:hypothetical protein